MKTDDLIAALALESWAQSPRAAVNRLGLALALGASVSLLAVLFWLKFQPLGNAVAQGWFWMKALYTLGLAAPGLGLVFRLARPEAQLGRWPFFIIVVLGLMAAWATVEWLETPSQSHASLWMGETARVCPIRILLLAAPVYIALGSTMRSLAPTRLVLAGAAAGLLSGSVAATLYELHCREQGAAFVVSWYTLGIALCAVLGGLAGRWVLRW